MCQAEKWGALGVHQKAGFMSPVSQTQACFLHIRDKLCPPSDGRPPDLSSVLFGSLGIKHLII